MPEHPSPNEVVILPGHELIPISMYIMSFSLFMAMVRKRKILLDFSANWLESFVALNGAALFISPFVALAIKFLFQMVANNVA